MKRINEAQLKALEALNTYRFLSVQQMIQVGVSNTKYGISRTVQALLAGNKPLIKVADFGTFPTIGRLPVLYYLSKWGAEWLGEAFQVDTQDINAPKGAVIFTRDYYHRVQTIDTHISVRKFTQSIEGMECNFFHTYFEQSGANRTKDPDKKRKQALTKIPLKNGEGFVPDAIFSLTDPDGKEWLFTAEIYRNMTTKRTYQQLQHHAESLDNGTISDLYQYKRAVRLLVVCEQENAMKALQKRLAGDELFKHCEPFMLFKTLEQVQHNFPYGWQTFSGKEMNAFGIPKSNI
jgi:hypothetical protein